MSSARAMANKASAHASEMEHATCVPIATPHACGADELMSTRRGEDEARNHEVRCVPMTTRDDAMDATRATTRASRSRARTMTDLMCVSCARRAYKLGKKKRSYNQVELTFERQRVDNGNFSKASAKKVGTNAEETTMRIFEAAERTFGEDVPRQFQESALEYELKLYNGELARAVVYLVYAEPLKADVAPGKKSGVSDGHGYTWLPVSRDRCIKGCDGPILSAIQRFGKQGRTQKSAAATAAQTAPANPAADDKWKDSRNLFISIDEASNHVCPYNKCKVFRLLFGVYTHDTNEFLGSGVSGPIRVLANNDVPKGAAAMRVRCVLDGAWDGWNTGERSEEDLREIFKGMCANPPIGKPNQDKVRDKRPAEAPESARAAPSRAPAVKLKAATKRPIVKDSGVAPAKRSKAVLGRMLKNRQPKAQRALQELPNASNEQDALDMPPPESHDLSFLPLQMMASPLGTPPDADAAGFAGMFGTPVELMCSADMRDVLNTSDLPSLCTPGDQKQNTQFPGAEMMPPPTTGGLAHMRFTPGALPPMGSSGSLGSISLASLGSFGPLASAFKQTPAEFKAKTMSRAFTRSARKNAEAKATPNAFLASILASGNTVEGAVKSVKTAAPSVSVQKPTGSRRATRRALKDVENTVEPRTAAATAKVEAPPASMTTAVASAPGVSDEAFDDIPVRGLRSRQPSPNGLAPTRLLFSPVPKGMDAMHNFDDSDDEKIVANEAPWISPTGIRTYQAQRAKKEARTYKRKQTEASVSMPRMASVTDVGELVTAQKPSERAGGGKSRLSSFFVRPSNAPPPPELELGGVGNRTSKRKTRNSGAAVHFRGDVNFENAPSTSKRRARNEDVEQTLLSPQWPSKHSALSPVDTNVQSSMNSPGFMNSLKSMMGWPIGATGEGVDK